MKLRSLINFEQAIQVVTGVNIHFGEGDSVEISVVALEQKKQIVKLRSASSFIQSLEQLNEYLDKNIPRGCRLHVNIEGKGVLQKNIPKNQLHNHVILMRNVFPMVREEDFVSQLYYGLENDFLLVARKDILASLLQVSSRYAWVSFSLGPFITSALVPLLEREEVLIKNYTIHIASEKIVAVNPNSNVDTHSIPFAQESISSDLFLAYCSAWYLLLGTSGLTFSKWGPEKDAAERYQLNTHLYSAGKSGLFVLLGALLLNIALYFYLQKNVDDLEAQESFVMSRYQKTAALQKQADKLRKMYSNIGWRSNLVPVFYADQIALLVPQEIQLTSLDIGILDDAVLRTERRHVYEKSLIQIKGLTKDPVSLQKLIELLEKYPWVEEIYQHRYRHDARQNLGVFEFVVRIK
jgi:Tfp pilus assembly protein PilN